MFRTLIVTAVVSLLSISASYAREWDRLGEHRVDFHNDHDVIPVGGRQGKFRRLKLIVHRNDIKLNSVHVVFGNGEREKVEFQRTIPDGGEAVINFPYHEGRFIREVELHYHTEKSWFDRERAEVVLWGQED
jgi:hypothetical protein